MVVREKNVEACVCVCSLVKSCFILNVFIWWNAKSSILVLLYAKRKGKSILSSLKKKSIYSHYGSKVPNISALNSTGLTGQSLQYCISCPSLLPFSSNQALLNLRRCRRIKAKTRKRIPETLVATSGQTFDQWETEAILLLDTEWKVQNGNGN